MRFHASEDRFELRYEVGQHDDDGDRPEREQERRVDHCPNNLAAKFGLVGVDVGQTPEDIFDETSLFTGLDQTGDECRERLWVPAERIGELFSV